jgi:hypothetical protein
MSDQKPHNPSAYPQSGDMHYSKRGMTLRDHFAGLAMQAIISKQVNNVFGASVKGYENIENLLDMAEGVSDCAYEIANEMLRSRKD